MLPMRGPSVVVQVTLVLELPQVKGGASSKVVKSSLIWLIRGLHLHTLYLTMTNILSLFSSLESTRR